MVKDSILFEIFVRYLKEKGWFNEYKKCIPSNYFTALETRFRYFSNSILEIFKIIDGKKQYKYNILELNKLIGHNDNISEFNNIINSYLLEYCISFIEEYDLLGIFTKTLVTYKNSTQIPFIVPDYKNIYDKKCQYKILNTYLDAYLRTNHDLFNLINYAFTWGNTDKGYDYWYDMHHLLKNYLWSKLLIQKKVIW